MAKNERGQNLTSKYVWVIETINRAKKISFEELNEKWLDDTDISRGIELPKRTFKNWCDAIFDMFGIIITNEGRGKYRYFIENEEDIRQNGISSWIYNAFSVSNTLSNSLSLKNRILLENVPSGQKYLQPIIEAMKENKVLNMSYRSYRNEKEYCYNIQPYSIKLFRQRWYMIARCTHPSYYEKGPIIYALDRIKHLNITNERFEMPKDWDAEKYFDGCFGIIVGHDIDIQPVKLKVAARQANYIRDLKIHESQEEIERNDEYSIFSYNLRPSFDFQQEILWNGEDMEVLEPEWLRKEMAGKIERMWNKYSASENKDKLV
ncbi:MAG: WYL domain-containing protein [Bacteroidales bacterium]|nr:WYL domain-containing protein [Bacteroidales bacterium]